MYYYVWITIGGIHLDEIPGGQLVSALQDIWDNGIAGSFHLARHEEDQAIFCVRRSLYDDYEFLMSGAGPNDDSPLFTPGIGGRKIDYDGESDLDGVEVTNKAKVKQFKAEYKEAIDQSYGPYIDLFKRARITADPPDPTLSGQVILP